MIGYEAAALGAATLWAAGGLIAAGPTRTLGGPRFTRLRMYWVTGILIVIAFATGGWSTVERFDVLLLTISGIAGLAFGDATLFIAFERLGPRRTGMLFAANAPITAVLSAIIFGETFSSRAIIGSGLVLAGVAMSIALGTRPGQSHTWEAIKGSVWVGIGFGLLGAAGQSIGVLFADPAFDGDLDPWAGAAIRAIAGLVVLVAMRGWFERRAKIPHPGRLGVRLWAVIILSGTVAMVIGKTLVLFALREGDPGIVSVLVSMAPALQLPLIWAFTRSAPALGAWIGSAAAVAGTALIVL